MKKLVLTTLLVGLFLIPTVSVSAQNEKKETAHWSFGVKGGANYFRVYPQANDYLTDAGYGGSAFLAYTINPLWGFGLNADYLSYNRDKNRYLGNTIDATLYTDVNLSNLLAPQRQGKFWKAVNTYAIFGVGVAIYSCEDKLLDTKLENELTGVATAGLGADINLGKRLSLGLEAQYRYYPKQDLGGEWTPNKDGCDALYASIGLRYKFNGAKKDHVRNMLPSNNTDEVLDAFRNELEQLKNQLNKTDDDVKNLSDDVNNTNKKQDQINKDLKNDIDNLRKALEDLKTQKEASAVMQNIEFKFDSADLSATSFSALDDIVATLKSNSTWNKVTIAGHTDNIGTKELNKKLSEARANAVKEYLVKNGIPASKIETVGYGAEKPVASNSTSNGRQQNRRVEFNLSK